MAKVEVTDEMVERAWNAASFQHASKETIRDCLEAALNPPPQPAVDVTAAMLTAAWKVVGWSEHHPDAIAKTYAMNMAAEIYRAMYAVRPKDDLSWVCEKCRRAEQGNVLVLCCRCGCGGPVDER